MERPSGQLEPDPSPQAKLASRLLVSFQYLHVQLAGGAPWGFTLRGGLEHGEPLIVSKVSLRRRPGSPPPGGPARTAALCLPAFPPSRLPPSLPGRCSPSPAARLVPTPPPTRLERPAERGGAAGLGQNFTAFLGAAPRRPPAPPSRRENSADSPPRRRGSPVAEGSLGTKVASGRSRSPVRGSPERRDARAASLKDGGEARLGTQRKAGRQARPRGAPAAQSGESSAGGGQGQFLVATGGQPRPPAGIAPGASLGGGGFPQGKGLSRCQPHARLPPEGAPKPGAEQ